MAKKENRDIEAIRNDLAFVLNQKYYNLWMSKYDSDLDQKLHNYIFKKYWEIGTVGAFKPAHLDEFIAATYTAESFNRYDFPEKIRFNNPKNDRAIPNKQFVVGKDAVIGYCTSNHKGIKLIVNKYIKRLVDVQMVINTNLTVHKLPFLVGISPADEDKAKSIVAKILNDEPVIFVDLADLQMVKSVVNSSPYIIDKLCVYYQKIECELLTYLGLDNSVSEKVNLDITNANNSLINAFKNDIDYNVQQFFKQIEEVLGIHCEVFQREELIQSVYEEQNPELENNTGNTGTTASKEDEEDDEK